MKKRISILIILLILTMFTINVQATTTTSEFTSDSTTIKAGDTVKITLSLTNTEAINGMTTSLKFDTNVFEYQEATLQDTTNYSFLSNTVDDIAVIATTETGATTLKLDITLKVKENPTTGNTTVSTEAIVVDQLNADTKETLGAKSVSFTVVENVVTPPNNEGTNNDNNNNNNNNNNAQTPSIKEEEQQTVSKDPTTTNKSGTDSTVTGSKIPQTGGKEFIIIATVIIIAISAIVWYVKYRKYKNI